MRRASSTLKTSLSTSRERRCRRASVAQVPPKSTLLGSQRSLHQLRPTQVPPFTERLFARTPVQDSALMRKLNSVLAKRVIKFLNDQAKKDEQKYLAFFKEFGQCARPESTRAHMTAPFYKVR
eukprot:6199991-Pleurochrysis_carterae.AAC.2